MKHERFNKYLLVLCISTIFSLRDVYGIKLSLISQDQEKLRGNKNDIIPNTTIEWDELQKHPKYATLVQTINNLRGGNKGSVKSVFMPANYFDTMIVRGNININISNPDYSFDIPFRYLKYNDSTAAEKKVFDHFKFDKNFPVKIIGFVPKIIQIIGGSQELINGSFSTVDYSKVIYLNWLDRGGPYGQCYIENPSLNWNNDMDDFR